VSDHKSQITGSRADLIVADDVESANNNLSFYEQVKAFYGEKQDLRIKRRVGRIDFFFEWRAKSRVFGRFGGGWNWALGFKAGGRTVMLNLLVAMLCVSWHKEAKR
jgi:hypothetical protein